MPDSPEFLYMASFNLMSTLWIILGMMVYGYTEVWVVASRDPPNWPVDAGLPWVILQHFFKLLENELVNLLFSSHIWEALTWVYHGNLLVYPLRI